MTKVKRIYLQNFKGVKGIRIIDLDSDSSLLVGPNGFGKTTIFDAMELCITNSIYRTTVTKVTKDYKDYSKPFFQNEKDKDVCIKVWLEDDGGHDLIIVRYYDHSNDLNYSGRKNKPSDFDKLFRLYTQDPDYFDQSVNQNNMRTLNEDQISSYLELDKDDYDISNIYRLFVYLQQEETTFFLKQGEKDRKTSLGFLVESSNQEDKVSKYTTQITEFNKALTKLRDKKNSLLHMDYSHNTQYEQVFQWKEDEILDVVDPFQRISTKPVAQINKEIMEMLLSIKEFILSFSPKEYQKKIKDDYFMRQVQSNDFYKAMVLEAFLYDSQYLDLQYKKSVSLNNIDYPARLLLNNAEVKGDQLAEDADKYEFLQEKIENNKLLFKLEITTLEKYLKMTGFNEDKIVQFRVLMQIKYKYENRLNDLNKKIADMESTRRDLREKHQNEFGILDNHTCPYCGSNWELKEKLEAAYDELTTRLTTENRQIHELIKTTSEKIVEDYFNPASERAKNICQNIVPVPRNLISYIQKNQRKDLNGTYLNYFQNELDGNILPQSNKRYERLEDLETDGKNLLRYLQDKLLDSKEIIDTLRSLETKNFEKQKQFLKSVFPEENFEKYKLPRDIKLSSQLIDDRVETLRVYLQSLRKKFEYSVEQATDKNNLYENIFNESEQNFYSVTVEKLKLKNQYIQEKFAETNNQKLQIINERIRLLESATDDLKQLKKIYTEQITSYKANMIQILQVPFFILTGKILQNYQQGMGVFITSSDNGGIRFITDQSSDHDAMHHLSTGQISVISLAFTLACKKCYDVANQMNFLVIDDPIQDMDSLNIQAFVDVLRRNYLEDNQIIVATHSDNSAALIKYKMERFDSKKEVKFIDVQEKFYSSKINDKLL